MIAGIVDTTVIVHLIRGETVALDWLATMREPLGITSVTWIEVMRGENNKARRPVAKGFLDLFELVYLEHADQDFVMQAVAQDPGMKMADCMIAAVAYRVNVPLYTHNLADMRRVLKRWKILEPYPSPS